MSDSFRPHRPQSTRLLQPWDFPGKSTGVGCHCLLRYTHTHPIYQSHTHTHKISLPGDSHTHTHTHPIYQSSSDLHTHTHTHTHPYLLVIQETQITKLGLRTRGDQHVIFTKVLVLFLLPASIFLFIFCGKNM